MSISIEKPSQALPTKTLGHNIWSIVHRDVPDLSQLPLQEAEDWRKQLAPLAEECGCTMGTITALISLGLYLFVIILNLGGMTGNIWVGMGVFVLGIATGKFIGKARAAHIFDTKLNILKQRMIELNLSEQDVTERKPGQ
jgi:hypothetical protein